MLDHPSGNMASANSAVLVSLDFSSIRHAESLNELRQLAASDALEISAVVNGKRTRPDPALFAGTGKVDEIALVLEHTGAPTRMQGDRPHQFDPGYFCSTREKS
jgi:GTP-binding protein HflX